LVPRRIATNFEEHRAEIGIVNIEVVVVNVDGLVTRVLELAIDFLALECLCLLLRHANEHNPITNGQPKIRCIYTPHSLRATNATLLLDGNNRYPQGSGIARP
jgi:hypothetical protein